MSDINKFKQDFDIWEQSLREEGETEHGIKEIRDAVRSAWPDKELRSLWIQFVAKKAANHD